MNDPRRNGLLCVCVQCRSMITLSIYGEQERDTDGWYEYTCGSCGHHAYICHRDYMRWFNVAKRRNK